MKWWILLLWSQSFAFAVDPMYYGEWEEVGRKAYLNISERYFIFRHCGRFGVIHTSTKHEAILFTGLDNWCLGSGEHKCALSLTENFEMIVNCGEGRYKRSYHK